LKKSRIDGGSSLLIPVPARQAPAASMASSSNNNNNAAVKSPCGGVAVLGQRQITFGALNHYKVMPIPPALILSWDNTGCNPESRHRLSPPKNRGNGLFVLPAFPSYQDGVYGGLKI
jgi:hypothetical protein